jgi:hypothetical protein
LHWPLVDTHDGGAAVTGVIIASMVRALAASLLLTLVAVVVPSADARAQGIVYLEGGVLTTAILNDTQETASGFLHYAFIGELDWPTAGLFLGGGARVARHVSAGAELAQRRTTTTTISEQSHGHTDRQDLSSLYTSRERLLSFVVRGHAPAGRLELQPLGGVTVSWAERTLTG